MSTEMIDTSVPRVSVSFTDPDFNRNPFPTLASIRELGPIVYNELAGQYLVCPYRSVRRLQRRDADFGQAHEGYRDMLGGMSIVSADDGLHAAFRGLYNPPFERGSVATYEDMVRGVMRSILGPMFQKINEGKVVDPVKEGIGSIPMLVMAEVLGLPEVYKELGPRWLEGFLDLFNVFSEPDAARAATMRAEGRAVRDECNAFVGELISERRSNEGPMDLIRLLVESDLGRELQEIDLRATISLLIVAAQDNTANMMAMMLETLAKYPDQRDAIANDRSLIPQAVEESLRYQPSLGTTPRIARKDGIVFEGVRIPKGSEVYPVFAAANRDPENWDNPDEFDIFRDQKAHVAFGFGRHVCIGMNLARVELNVFLEEVFEYMPEYRLVSPVIEYGRNFMTRGPISLPISR